MSLRVLAQGKPSATTAAPVRGNLLQRKCACGGTPGPTGECNECRKKRLQRKTAQHSTFGTQHSEVPPIVHEVLRSPGHPLDANTREFMESRFGHDFGHVRVHTDAPAAQSTQAVSARAYTVGSQIVFDRSRYAPETLEGCRLLAHELAHVVQQSSADGPQPGASHEMEAEAAGRTAGRSPVLLKSAPGSIQGAPDKEEKRGSNAKKEATVRVAWSNDSWEFEDRVVAAVARSRGFRGIPDTILPQYLNPPAASLHSALEARHFKPGHRVSVQVSAFYAPDSIPELWQVSMTSPDTVKPESRAKAEAANAALAQQPAKPAKPVPSQGSPSPYPYRRYIGGAMYWWDLSEDRFEIDDLDTWTYTVWQVSNGVANFESGGRLPGAPPPPKQADTPEQPRSSIEEFESQPEFAGLKHPQRIAKETAEEGARLIAEQFLPPGLEIDEKGNVRISGNPLDILSAIAHLPKAERTVKSESSRLGRLAGKEGKVTRHSGFNVPYRIIGDTGKLKGTSVYVLKDAEGTILYVGKGEALDRLREHIKDPKKTEWFGEIDSVTIHATGLNNTEALALEENLIGQLRPLHNIDQRPFQKEFGTAMALGPNLPKAQALLTFNIEWGH